MGCRVSIKSGSKMENEARARQGCLALCFTQSVSLINFVLSDKKSV